MLINIDLSKIPFLGLKTVSRLLDLYVKEEYDQTVGEVWFGNLNRIVMDEYTFEIALCDEDNYLLMENENGKLENVEICGECDKFEFRSKTRISYNKDQDEELILCKTCYALCMGSFN